MAWKSLYLAGGMVSTAALPFFSGTEGAANLPDGPCIVVANHSSFLDGPLLSLAYFQEKLLPLHMIAYEEPFSNWLMGWILRSGGCIPFKRGDRRSQWRMLVQAMGWLKAGEAVGVFPEGHINWRPLLNRPRPGAALLAMETGYPLIPAAIIGSDVALPRGARVPNPQRSVRVRFGGRIGLFPKERLYRTLPPDERAMTVRNLGYRIMTTIGKLCGRDCLEEA